MTLHMLLYDNIAILLVVVVSVLVPSLGLDGLWDKKKKNNPSGLTITTDIHTLICCTSDRAKIYCVKSAASLYVWGTVSAANLSLHVACLGRSPCMCDGSCCYPVYMVVPAAILLLQ